eukprot:7303786-Alexandrium_andersonii.AAC.1
MTLELVPQELGKSGTTALLRGVVAASPPVVLRGTRRVVELRGRRQVLAARRGGGRRPQPTLAAA